MSRLSILVPAYNEQTTIAPAIRRIRSAPVSGMEIQIIVVDDGSTDETARELQGADCIVLTHENNRGKGAAVRTALTAATGDFVVIQDADLEYDPVHYPELLAPILAGHADAVYGCRFVSAYPHRVLSFWHYIANRAITLLSNCMTGLHLTDIETGHKAFSRAAIDRIMPHLTCDRFGIEPELTALAARMGLRISEVGVSYHGRTYEDGKKIRAVDGLAAVWHIIWSNIRPLR
jgi:glycosyltransferase involved in cell wall biosynthesis